MLSTSENDALTRVSPGTPMGELMRRYWHPVAAASELDERPTKALRILGEDLVLYRDRSGTLGLIERLCPHRRVDLSYGIPEDDGLRCMYHGWMFDETGQCIEQPFEETVHPSRVSRPGSEPGSSEAVDKAGFKEKVRVRAYPVQVLAGMVFAYMGPQPAPLLPNWEPFSYDNGFINIAIAELPTNWLHCAENGLDSVHLEWLHAYWGTRLEEERARARGEAPEVFPRIVRRHLRIGFDLFDYGIIKRRLVEGASEEHHDWTRGHPMIFPNVVFVGNAIKSSFQYKVPIDDENTLHLTWYFYRAAPGHNMPVNDDVPFFRVPLHYPDGRSIDDVVNNQDFMTWVSQGAIADRSMERLGESDTGIIMYRKLLRDQMDIVAKGGDPMALVRDPAKNARIELPLEKWQALQTQRTSKYVPEQAGETPEQRARVQAVFDTWADEKPWEEAAGTKAAQT